MDYFTWVAAYRAWVEACYRVSYARGEAYDAAVAAWRLARQAWIEADLAYAGRRGPMSPSHWGSALLAEGDSATVQPHGAR